jgi:hypothetical protein
MYRCILGGDIGELCINMFLFAKAYDIPILRRDSINRLVLCFDPNGSYGLHLSDKSPIPTEAIQRAYKNTNVKSPLRRILVTGFCQYSDQDEVMKADMPSQFLVDIITRCQSP